MGWTIEKIQQMYKEQGEIKYLFFWGHQKAKHGGPTKSCLSQWWHCRFSDKEYDYMSAEQYMMSEKAELFGDSATRKKILASNDPKEIKKLGRQVKNFEQTVWDKQKYGIVVQGNYLKFTQDNELRHYLLATGNEVIVEASPVDTVWGVGLSEDDLAIENPLLWQGENLLGFALMDVRERILREV